MGILTWKTYAPPLVTIGTPKRKRRMHIPVVNCLLRGLKRSGHMSTMPVTRLSTMQNSLSIPMVCAKNKEKEWEFQKRGQLVSNVWAVGRVRFRFPLLLVRISQCKILHFSSLGNLSKLVTKQEEEEDEGEEEDKYFWTFLCPRLEEQNDRCRLFAALLFCWKLFTHLGHLAKQMNHLDELRNPMYPDLTRQLSNYIFWIKYLANFSTIYLARKGWKYLLQFEISKRMERGFCWSFCQEFQLVLNHETNRRDKLTKLPTERKLRR